MNPLTLLIVDDEAPARARLKDVLADCAAELPAVVAGEAATGREALDWLATHHADVAVLDIHMPGMSGIETARHLQALARPPAVIFATAFDDYALQAFEVHAIDYLVKPVRRERLLAALRRARALVPAALAALGEARRHLAVHERQRLRLIPIEDVAYLRAELKYVTVRTPDGEHLVEESLTHLENEFGARFLRIHRNCLVARDFITALEKGPGESGWQVALRGISERLPVSRRQLAAFRQAATGKLLDG
jgi:two-component system response regulator AlgR